MTCEIPDFQAGFRKGRGTRDQITNIWWVIEKAGEFQRNIYFCFIGYDKAFDCVDHNKLWKILKEMGMPDPMTSVFRNPYSGQEATVRTGMEQQTSSKLGKEYIKAVYCHHTYLIYMHCTSWETLGGMKHKLESRLPGEISVLSDMQIYHPYGRKWRTKEPLDESERGKWKSWLKAQCSEN